MKRLHLSVRSKITLLQSFIILFFIVSCILQINSLFRLKDINSVHTGFIQLKNQFNESEAGIKDIIITQSLSVSLDDANLKVKGIVSSMDRLVTNLRPALSGQQESSIKEETDAISSSLHEYSVILDELTRRTKGFQTDSRTESQQILDNTSGFLDFAGSVKNEYFAFLLKDISDLSRRYSITPGNDVLRKLSGRLEEAGKILATNDAAAFISSGESSKNILFTKLSDTKVIVSTILQNNSKTVSIEEGTINRLNRTGKEIKQNFNILDEMVAMLYSGFFKRTLLIELFLLLLMAGLLILYFRRFAKSQITFLNKIGHSLRQLVSGKLPQELDLGQEIEFVNMETDLGVFVGDLK